MSTDLTTEFFAIDLFGALGRHHGLISGPPTQVSDEFNENILRAVQVRQAMFHFPYLEIFEKTYAEFVGSASDFFEAIVNFFPHYLRDDDPEEESVMCAFLSSCAFVAVMSIRGGFLAIGHKVWAMFVDLYLQAPFLKAGGWAQLQAFAANDCAVYDFVRTFSDVTDTLGMGENVLIHRTHLTIAAVDSFNAFEAWEGIEDDVPYALKWVDFCVHKPQVKIPSPSRCYQPIPYIFDRIEAAIWSISLFCNIYERDDVSHSSTCSSNTDLNQTELYTDLMKVTSCANDEEDASEFLTCYPSTKNDLNQSSVNDEKQYLTSTRDGDNELGNLAKRDVKTRRLEIEKNINDQISISGDEQDKTLKPPTKPSNTKIVRKADTNMSTRIFSKDKPNIISISKYFPVSISEDLSSPRCQMDDIERKSSLTQSDQASRSSKVSHQRSALRSDDENYDVLEKPLKVFESTDKEDQSNPSKKNECKDQNSSLESTTEKKLNFAARARDEPKRIIKTQYDDKLLQKNYEYDMNSVEKSSLTHFKRTPSSAQLPLQSSALKIDGENYHIFEKSLSEIEKNNPQLRPPTERQYDRRNRRISQDSSASEKNSSAESNIGSQSSETSGAEPTSKFRTKMYFNKSLQKKTECETTSVASTSEIILDKEATSGKKEFDTIRGLLRNIRNALEVFQNENKTADLKMKNLVGVSSEPGKKRRKMDSNEESNSVGLSQEAMYQMNEDATGTPLSENPLEFSPTPQDVKKKKKKGKSNKGSNSVGLNQGTFQTTVKRNTTAEPELENQFGLSSCVPQHSEEKGKEKNSKKELTRLETRVKEEGSAIKDVMRLILVMGHHPGMVSVASKLSKEQFFEDDDTKESFL